MKKMLDELKKLDVEYEVPQDFKKKVMEKIKAESVKEECSNKNKVLHLKRYVIACASVAAMFIVVVNATGMGDKFAMQESADSSIQMDAMNSATSNSAPSKGETENLKDYDNFNGIVDGFVTEDKVAMDSETSRAETPSASLKENISLKRMEKVLNDYKIDYEILENELFIAKDDLQKLKDSIEKEILDNIEFVEKEDKIQIIIK